MGPCGGAAISIASFVTFPFNCTDGDLEVRRERERCAMQWLLAHAQAGELWIADRNSAHEPPCARRRSPRTTGVENWSSTLARSSKSSTGIAAAKCQGKAYLGKRRCFLRLMENPESKKPSPKNWAKCLNLVGWPTGLEPATTGITILDSTN
jgi:hypothetical protein